MKFGELEPGQVFEYNNMRFVKIQEVDSCGCCGGNAIYANGDITSFDDTTEVRFISYSI